MNDATTRSAHPALTHRKARSQMNTTSSSAPRWRPWQAVVIGGIGAGAADLAYAFAFYGVRGIAPSRILQTIASGVLGVPAFSGGWPAALLGAVLHFSILLVAAALFLAASRRLKWMTSSAFAAGAVYGVAIYFVMNAIVVPLSAAPALRHTALGICSDFAMHVLVLGPIIALAARRAA